MANASVQHNTGKAPFTMPAAVYLALCTGLCSQFQTGATIAEANYTGYARQQVPAASLGTAANGLLVSTANIVFAACTGGTATILAAALVDSAGRLTGNGLYYCNTLNYAISNGVVPTFYAGSLVFQES